MNFCACLVCGQDLDKNGSEVKSVLTPLSHSQVTVISKLNTLAYPYPLEPICDVVCTQCYKLFTNLEACETKVTKCVEALLDKFKAGREVHRAKGRFKAYKDSQNKPKAVVSPSKPKNKGKGKGSGKKKAPQPKASPEITSDRPRRAAAEVCELLMETNESDEEILQDDFDDDKDDDYNPVEINEIDSLNVEEEGARTTSKRKPTQLRATRAPKKKKESDESATQDDISTETPTQLEETPSHQQPTECITADQVEQLTLQDERDEKILDPLYKPLLL